MISVFDLEYLLTSQRAIDALKSKDERTKRKEEPDICHADYYCEFNMGDEWFPEQDNTCFGDGNEVTSYK